MTSKHSHRAGLAGLAGLALLASMTCCRRREPPQPAPAARGTVPHEVRPSAEASSAEQERRASKERTVVLHVTGMKKSKGDAT
ncbi:MAG: hypothetical protein D6731_18045 [Planctomycetota bacterium]|nr:MAG: hypothetical protein D6731_18045 [Planctomycetota bacterium]